MFLEPKELHSSELLAYCTICTIILKPVKEVELRGGARGRFVANLGRRGASV